MGRQTSVEGSDVLGFRHEVSKRSFDDSQSVKALSRVTGTTSVAGHSAPEQRSKKETSPTLLVSDSLDEEWWLGKPFFKTVRAFRFTTHGELHQVALAHCQSECVLAAWSEASHVSATVPDLRLVTNKSLSSNRFFLCVRRGCGHWLWFQHKSRADKLFFIAQVQSAQHFAQLRLD